ncbi:mercuric transporter MerT family protein [Mesorhizobium xinjiangense]|uniref:mercuric transporter MerT family protein n=1 Tax=Mesorhizobium xinjiangense TaxID=2678685 RepID=UPI0012EE2029|nr:mercuric transporter MerT family protein [Mesorhizobium xinjiangense]
MSETKIETVVLDAPAQAADRRQGWFAAGGVIGAILASTCCIAPLVLLTLGVSGTWIGSLTALEPYKPIFAGVALVFIGFGFRRVYFNAKPACEDGSRCARAESALIAKSALWLSTVLVVLALTINWWAPFFY